MDDLKERLRGCVAYGYMPRQMREIATEAADRIAELESQLAARDAEILEGFRERLESYCPSSGPGVPRSLAKQRNQFHRQAILALDGTMRATPPSHPTPTKETTHERG